VPRCTRSPADPRFAEVGAGEFAHRHAPELRVDEQRPARQAYFLIASNALASAPLTAADGSRSDLHNEKSLNASFVAGTILGSRNRVPWRI
jgi:hypothetical protein